MKEIFAALLTQLRAGNDAMLATLIEQTGSGPRGLGAQMVLTRAGRTTGTIGGGWVEREMMRAGLALLEERRSGLHACAAHGGQTGAACGGEITVHFAYAAAGDPAWTALLPALLAQIDRRRGGWLALRLHDGAPALLDEDGRGVIGCAPQDAQALCRPFAVRAGDAFALPLKGNERAVIFGAGHCAQALVPLLASVDFRVTVYDDRPALALPGLFPQAERVICAPFGEIDAHIALTQDDYVVAMSSTHASDLCVLRQVLTAKHAYTGMLGGGPKRAFVAGKLLEGGVPQARIDRVHTPIGLDIGAVTPAEIAVSIAAEMVKVRAENRARAEA